MSSRGVSMSPACGPAAVTRVPATQSSSSTPEVAQASRFERSRHGRADRTVDLTEPLVHPDGHRQQTERDEHVRRHGPPGQAEQHGQPAPDGLEQHPAGNAAGEPDQRLRRGCARQISRKVPSEATSTTPVSVRLPNSMSWWTVEFSSRMTGTSEPGWHSGQVGQPSPEPVTLTTAPVTAIARW